MPDTKQHEHETGELHHGSFTGYVECLTCHRRFPAMPHPVEGWQCAEAPSWTAHVKEHRELREKAWLTAESEADRAATWRTVQSVVRTEGGGYVFNDFACEYCGGTKNPCDCDPTKEL